MPLRLFTWGIFHWLMVQLAVMVQRSKAGVGNSSRFTETASPCFCRARTSLSVRGCVRRCETIDTRLPWRNAVVSSPFSTFQWRRMATGEDVSACALRKMWTV